jgi:RNA polymerase sigma factor (sigma-70 family)
VHLMHRSDVQLLGEEEAVAIGNSTLFRCAQSFRPELGYTFSTYACKPIARSIITAAEKQARQPRPSSLKRDVPCPPPDSDDHSEDVGTAMDALPINLQRIVRLRFGLDTGTGLSYVDLGRAIGLSATAARHRVEQALERMRD